MQTDIKILCTYDKLEPVEKLLKTLKILTGIRKSKLLYLQKSLRHMGLGALSL